MAGNQEYEYSSEAYPTPQGSARVLLDAAHRRLLIHGTNWAQYEPIIPGATQAGMFVEVVKRAKQLKVRSSDAFMLPKMIWYEAANMLPKTPDEKLSGEARAILTAIIGGQLYTSAVKQEIPEAIGDFYDDSRPASEPHSLIEIFSIPIGSPRHIYSGGPSKYRAFKAKLATYSPLFSDEEVQYAEQIAAKEAPDRRGDRYSIVSRVLLETFIGKLQQAKQSEIEQAPPLLPSATRRNPTSENT